MKGGEGGAGESAVSESEATRSLCLFRFMRGKKEKKSNFSSVINTLHTKEVFLGFFHRAKIARRRDAIHIGHAIASSVSIIVVTSFTYTTRSHSPRERKREGSSGSDVRIQHWSTNENGTP